MTRNPNAKSLKLLVAALAIVTTAGGCATTITPPTDGLRLNDGGAKPAAPNTFRG
jgi:hypothetical protein